MEVGRLAGIRGSGSRIFPRDVYLEMGSGWDPKKVCTKTSLSLGPVDPDLGFWFRKWGWLAQPESVLSVPKILLTGSKQERPDGRFFFARQKDAGPVSGISSVLLPRLGSEVVLTGGQLFRLPVTIFRSNPFIARGVCTTRMERRCRTSMERRCRTGVERRCRTCGPTNAVWPDVATDSLKEGSPSV